MKRKESVEKPVVIIAENENTEGVQESKKWSYIGPDAKKIYRDGRFFSPADFDEKAIETLFKNFDWAHEWFVNN